MRNPRATGQNCEGGFYTACGECIICDCPPRIAPSLVRMFIDPDGSHQQSTCYFYRQPETDAEIQLAVDACASSCVGALRYGGDDVEIIRRMIRQGLAANCDALEDHRRERLMPAVRQDLNLHERSEGRTPEG